MHQTLTWTTGSLTCALMLMQAIAHGGARTPNEILHWKLTLGRKSISAAMENQTCVSGMTVWCPTSWPTVRKRHCHCPAMWCHFVTGPCHVVVSSLHNVTLIWRHSYFIIHHSFLDLAGFFSGCGRQHWYNKCPSGVCIVFIFYASFHYCCSKIACVVRIREWLPDGV